VCSKNGSNFAAVEDEILAMETTAASGAVVTSWMTVVCLKY